MKRNLFIASVATIISTCLPTVAKAGNALQRAVVATNIDGPGWPKPTWSCESAVVWLEASSGVYYRRGDSRYGRTRHGAFSCEKHACDSGNRAA